MRVSSVGRDDLPALADLLAGREMALRRLADGSRSAQMLRQRFLRLLEEAALQPHVALLASQGGAPVAVAWANEVRNPLTGRLDGFAHTVAAVAGGDGEGTLQAELIARLLLAARERGLDLLKVRLVGSGSQVVGKACERSGLRLGLRLEEIMVEKRLDPGPAAEPAPSSPIRMAEEADLPFILGLAEQALANGMTDLERGRVAAEALRKAAGALVEPLLDRGGVVLVAEDEGGRPIGHALFEPLHHNEFRACVAPRIHDVFVLDAHRAKGVSLALGRACERLARSIGAPVIWGSVNPPGAEGVAALLAAIAGEGWSAVEERYAIGPLS